MAEGFAAVPTWMIRDERVSLAAIMVYASLASRGGLDAVIPSKSTIAREARCSVRSVGYALAELESLGVVERLERVGRGGARLSNEYVLSNRPRADHARGGAGGAGAPCTSEQSIPLIEVDNSEVDIPGANAPVVAPLAPVVSADGFDEWWAVYPLKRDKAKARRAWARVVRSVSVEVLVAAASAYAVDPNRDPRFTKYPASWLNAESWADGPLPARGGAGGFAGARAAAAEADAWFAAQESAAAEGYAELAADPEYREVAGARRAARGLPSLEAGGAQ